MKVEIISCQAAINSLGQSEHFQISLPRDTQRIIGIETGAICLDNAPGPDDPYGGLPIVDIRQDMDWLFFVMPKMLIGQVTLSAGQAGVIYQDDVWQWDNAFNYGDVLASTSMVLIEWVQGRHMRKASISVEGERFIEGYFKSTWNSFTASSVKFLLNIHLWVERP